MSCINPLPPLNYPKSLKKEYISRPISSRLRNSLRMRNVIDIRLFDLPLPRGSRWTRALWLRCHEVAVEQWRERRTSFTVQNKMYVYIHRCNTNIGVLKLFQKHPRRRKGKFMHHRHRLKIAIFRSIDGSWRFLICFEERRFVLFVHLSSSQWHWFCFVALFE